MRKKAMFFIGLSVSVTLAYFLMTGAADAGFRTISSGSLEEGDVRLDLTPERVENGKLVVRFAVDTHSVSLRQFDLKEATILEYNGKTVKPVEASRLGGHHAAGKLVFRVEDAGETFTIKVTGIPRVEERVFTWSMKDK